MDGDVSCLLPDHFENLHFLQNPDSRWRLAAAPFRTEHLLDPFGGYRLKGGFEVTWVLQKRLDCLHIIEATIGYLLLIIVFCLVFILAFGDIDLE